MQTLRDCVSDFTKSSRAIGHFNISDSNQLTAIAQASKETGLPAIVGLSEGERAFFPLSHARALVDLYQKAGVQLYLNADHTYGLEKVKAAIDAGVDSVVVDGAQLSFDDNVALLKECVAYARASGRDVLMEGELGYIGVSSKVMDKLPEGVQITEETMTKPDELKKLIDEGGLDLAAPAVGNVHGVITSGNPKLSISRIGELHATAGVPLVLHGGSGSSDEEFVAAVKAGISIIHINTDLRLSYRNSLKATLDSSDEVAPYKFLAPSVTAMAAFVAQKLCLFAGQ